MTTKPLRLTIIPSDQVPTSIVVNNDFQYIPITQVIVQPNVLEEKERTRLEKQRARNARYNNKVAAYKKIATLPTEKDKVKALLLLCYPKLSKIDQMSSQELDLRLDTFITSLDETFNQ